MEEKKEDEKNREYELEDQLHEQYAVNDNSRNSVFISFIVGIIALFGFYGFVYVNTYKREISSEYRYESWNFNINIFLLMSFVTIGILFFLAILAIYLGYSLRRDQFIIYNIRKKRYKGVTEKETKVRMKEIFGGIYSPYNKDCSDYLPNFYNLFYWLFFKSEIFIFVTAILKICDLKNTQCPFYNCKDIVYIIFIMLFHIIFIILTPKFRRCYYKKYKYNEIKFKLANSYKRENS